MEISAKLADETGTETKFGNPKPTAKNLLLVFAFTGEVYRGLDAENIKQRRCGLSSKNHRILSGFIWIIKTIRQSNALPFRNGKKISNLSIIKIYMNFGVKKIQNKSTQNSKKIYCSI